jgi:hypothetical protein
MDRRRLIELSADPRLALYFYTPEDILLQKLLWFRQGGETSDRQWRDIRGIVLAQGQALDAAYLEKQAPPAGIADLLHRALRT